MIDRLEAAPIWLHILLLVLLVARLALLVTTDKISERPRSWLQAHGGTYVAYLVTCRWCVAFWSAWGASVAWVTWPGVTLLVGVALAAAFAGAWLVEIAVGPPPPPAPPAPHDD